MTAECGGAVLESCKDIIVIYLHKRVYDICDDKCYEHGARFPYGFQKSAQYAQMSAPDKKDG